jgi:hypothetical protein
MTEQGPILVVFGIDPEGKPRAACFAGKGAQLAAKAAALLGLRTAWITDEVGRAIAERLPVNAVTACRRASAPVAPGRERR